MMNFTVSLLGISSEKMLAIQDFHRLPKIFICILLRVSLEKLSYTKQNWPGIH